MLIYCSYHRLLVVRGYMMLYVRTSLRAPVVAKLKSLMRDTSNGHFRLG